MSGEIDFFVLCNIDLFSFQYLYFSTVFIVYYILFEQKVLRRTCAYECDACEKSGFQGCANKV